MMRPHRVWPRRGAVLEEKYLQRSFVTRLAGNGRLLFRVSKEQIIKLIKFISFT